MQLRLISLTACFALAAFAQQPPTPPSPLPLTQTETVQLQNYQLQRQLLISQFNQAMMQIQSQAEEFAAQTLAAHNHPKGITFDRQQLIFTKAAEPATPPKPAPAAAPAEKK